MNSRNSRNNGSPPRTPRQTGRAPPPRRLRRRPRQTRPASPSGGDDVDPLRAPQYTPHRGTNIGTTPLRRRPPTISNRRQLPNRSNRRTNIGTTPLRRRPNNNNVRRNLDNEHFRRIHQNQENRENNIPHRNYHDHTIPFDQRPDYQDPSTQRNINRSNRMPEPEQQTLKF